MRSSFVITRIAKYIVILILVAAFIFVIYWLWQRQPKIPNIQTPKLAAESNIIQTPESFKITPQDGSVLISKKVKLTGKANSGYLAIFSNDFQAVIKTDQNGKFEKEVELTNGLNLFKLVSFSGQLKQDQENSLVYLLAKDTKDGETVFAGPVKTILDNLLTISDSSGQKNIRSTKDTNITLPKPPAGEKNKNEASGSAIQNIRVGDFLIAQGNLAISNKKNEIIAKKIEVTREDKPQINKKLAVVKILASLRGDLFSVKDLETDEILQFNFGKNSEISQEDKEAKPEEITKNKNAIVIYIVKDDKNLVDLIYLLP